MKPRLTTTRIPAHTLERIANHPTDIDPQLWIRGHELWATMRWHPLDSEAAVRLLIPLLVAGDRVRELEARLALLEAAA